MAISGWLDDWTKNFTENDLLFRCFYYIMEAIFRLFKKREDDTTLLAKLELHEREIALPILFSMSAKWNIPQGHRLFQSIKAKPWNSSPGLSATAQITA